MKKTIRKIFTLPLAIKRSEKGNSSTVLISSMKKNFAELLAKGIITQKEFDAIFSEKTIEVLHSHRRLSAFLDNEMDMDIDMDMVSKDYFSDIISCIIGIQFPCKYFHDVSMEARSFVEEELHIKKKLFDLEKDFPVDIFVANNYKKVLQAYINRDRKYNRYSIPVMVKSNLLEWPAFTSMDFISCYAETETTVEDILMMQEDIIQDFSKITKNGLVIKDDDHLYLQKMKDILKTLLKYYDFDTLDFSAKLSRKGKKHQITMIEYVEKPRDDELYLDY